MVVALSACSSDGDQAGTGTTAPPVCTDPHTIVATTPIVGDLTSGVVGDLAEVEVVMPRGADPHAFEPSAREAAELTDADLVVAIGLGLESGLDPVLDQLADDGVPVLELGPQLSPIPVSTDAPDHGDEEAGDDHDDDHELGLDPHVWLDPDRMTSAAFLIADQVATVTGCDPDDLAANAAEVDADLRAADERVQALVADIPDERRVLVTNHASLGYFAERYGFEVVGTVVPGGSTVAEPSAADVAELAEVIEARGVPAIFVDATTSADLAEALAAEVGTPIEVVVLRTGSLGEPGSETEDLAGLLVADAERIAAALGG